MLSFATRFINVAEASSGPRSENQAGVGFQDCDGNNQHHSIDDAQHRAEDTRDAGDLQRPGGASDTSKLETLMKSVTQDVSFRFNFRLAPTAACTTLNGELIFCRLISTFFPVA